MENEKVYQMDFSKVYHLLVSKAEKKGRTRQEVDEVARWLTGYSQEELEGMLERPVSYGDFFRDAPEFPLFPYAGNSSHNQQRMRKIGNYKECSNCFKGDRRYGKPPYAAVNFCRNRLKRSDNFRRK